MSRWQLPLVATLALTGGGLLFAQPTLLAAALVPLAYVCYGAVSTGRDEPELAANRDVTPDAPMPGERVDISVTIENTGERVLPDVRVVEQVPELAVVSGSPRAATALSPGESFTFTYTVIGRHGTHEFADLTVGVRPLSGGNTVTATLSATGETAFECSSPAASSAVRDGQSGTQARSGGGIEFYATRAYRHGDPMRRIDWRHLAKTGEFVTVEYREQQPRKTAVIVDVRHPNRVPESAQVPSGAALSVDVAARVERALRRINALSGVGAVGVDTTMPVVSVDGVAWADAGSDDPSILCYAIRTTLADGVESDSTDRTVTDTTSDPAPRATVSTDGGESSALNTDSDSRTNQSTHSASSSEQPIHSDASTQQSSHPDVLTEQQLERLLSPLQTETRIVLCTPALDDWPVEFARAVTARNHELSVISPKISGFAGLDGRVTGLARKNRLRELSAYGETVSWTPGDALSLGGEAFK